MTKSAAMLVAVAVWTLAATAHAQTPVQQETVATSRLSLTLEQRHVIKELIKDLKITPAATSARTVGDNVPPDAGTQPVPVDIGRKVPQIKAHNFLYTSERILIVDPKDNKVAEVIELKAE